MLDFRRLLLELGECAGDIAMRDAEIADIGEVERLDLGPGCRMIAIDQHAAGLADRRRSEARPGPVRCAEIKGNPGDTDRRISVRALDTEKRRPDCKGRYRDHGLLSGEA